MFDDLAAHCNAHAGRQILRQRSFFAPFNEMLSVVQFYDQLKQTRSQLQPGEFLLRLSWGSGWHGMTGEFVDD